MAHNRFGASKYRNAVPFIPPREEWYRSSLPPGSTSTSSSVSTFSSEIKSNREYLVTVTASGDASWRSYSDSGQQPELGQGKVGSGGGVGDWDVGRLEGGEMILGGLDGAIYLYRLGMGKLDQVSSTPASGSAISHVSLHPTTPSIALTSSLTGPASIWNLSSPPSAPAIQLLAKEPKGMWCLAWSPDGTRVAGVGKSGTGYIWDPRTSTAPIMTRTLPLQPLKPVRIAWVGEDILVTSTSKTRSREYHLFSTSKSLATVFTQPVDTNTAPLIPVVDQERRIAYIAGKGDMTLRQVEFSGPMGFQETLHPLPHALASASLALASPTTLPVMQAQIATVLIPVVDKDGDAILPFGIRVPRRQLIDYHDDLFPDIQGFKSEQSPEEWFNGGNAAPLPISLDPARRSTWEADLGKSKIRPKTPAAVSEQPSTAPQPAAATAKFSPVADGQTSTDIQLPKAEKASSLPSAASKQASIAKPESFTPESREASDLPALEKGETYSSTSYKARIIAGHIKSELAKRGAGKGERPMFVGLQGPQGCGKTTLCDGFVAFLKEHMGISAAVLSLDDLYHTHANLKAVAQKHPHNQLLSGRGPPGTHDVTLAATTLAKVEQINASPNATVDLPIFDKSLQGGEGDRSERTVKVTGPIDVFILEGWSMGFSPLNPTRLQERYATFGAPEPYFASHSLESLTELNNYLAELSKAIYPFFSTLITVVPTSYEYVFAWRLQQEHAMKTANGGKGMTDQQVRAFVERYMPGYELWREGIWDQGWSGLVLGYGQDREVLSVRTIPAKAPAAGSSTVGRTNRSSASETKGETSPQPSSQPSLSSPGTGSGGDIKAAPASSVRLSATLGDDKAQPAVSRITSVAQPSTPSKPFNPTYSRKFLAAKSPLIPTYDSLPSLSTLHPDSLILKSAPHLAFFPVQGTGGRLGVHPLAKKGRMATGGEGYLSNGLEIADFAVELFDGGDWASRVAVAGEDGQVRVWKVGKGGVQGPGPEPDTVLKGKGIDKIAQVAFHPTAKDLLVAATNDHGASTLRFFDLTSGSESKLVPLDIKGVFNFSIHASGALVALGTKEGQVIVLDPRKPDSMASGKAHDSPRSFQLAWIDHTHLISVGFNKGSQRRINLYSVNGSEVKTDSSLLVDISPSVLFCHYDPDTKILFVWGKGERVISAYEINIGSTTEPIAKLPSYTAGEAQLGVAFLPKQVVDVRKVEVMKALRITAKAIEEVSFTIPRNKPEFFQDDIFVDTIDVCSSVATASEWLGGADRLPKYISLQPDGMTPLSQAPKTTSVAKAKFVPAKDVMTEEQKKKQEMDALFAKAKADESSEDEAPRNQKGLPPPDDDW